jgi:signal peptide peptidase SppA
MTAIDQREVWALLKAESAAWAIEPSYLSGLATIIARGERAAPAQQQAAQSAPGVAIVRIVGPLVRQGGFWSEMLGLTSYSAIRESLQRAVTDRSVAKIILLIDSPGGAAMGCEETAAAITAAARTKPLLSFIDGIAASAGYWLACQAPQITLTPSGEVGSIGVLLLHVDASAALERAGVTPTFIVAKASPHKTEGNQFEPLGTEARAHFQQGVDEVADTFIAAVARGRRVSAAKVRSDFGRGRMLRADAARAAGMVDRIGLLSDVIGSTYRSINLEPGTPMSEQQRSAARRRRLIIEAQT